MKSPYHIDEPILISFSGGRSSAYMLYKIIEENNGVPADSAVVFANTGKEEEATLQFVQACSDNWNVKITWIEYIPEEPGFKLVDLASASRDGTPYKQMITAKGYLPNSASNMCTIELKIRPSAKYCQSLGMDIGENDAWVGFRADEWGRVRKLDDKSRAPMFKDGVTKKTVANFWKSQSFDLALPNINGETPLGNCDLCFKKGGNKIPSIVAANPEKIIWWAEMEDLAKSLGATETGQRFSLSRPTYNQLKKFTKDQMPMDFGPSASCFCGD